MKSIESNIAVQLLLYLLKYRGSINKVADIATSLNCSVRAINYNINILICLGIPVNTKCGRYGSGIWIDQDYKFN